MRNMFKVNNKDTRTTPWGHFMQEINAEDAEGKKECL